MKEVKNFISVSVSIADALLFGVERAAAEKLQAALKENGVPDGTPVEVEILTRKYDYEARATWEAE